jgi:hypothetical protein
MPINDGPCLPKAPQLISQDPGQIVHAVAHGHANPELLKIRPSTVALKSDPPGLLKPACPMIFF